MRVLAREAEKSLCLHRLIVCPLHGVTALFCKDLKGWFPWHQRVPSNSEQTGSSLVLIVHGLNECLLVGEHFGISTFRTRLNPPDKEPCIIQSVCSVSSGAMFSDIRMLCRAFGQQQLDTVWWWINILSHLINKSYKCSSSLRNKDDKGDMTE